MITKSRSLSVILLARCDSVSALFLQLRRKVFPYFFPYGKMRKRNDWE